jgi:hypothetical protein
MIGIKNSEFYAGFKHTNLPQLQNAPKKSYYKKHAKLGLRPKMVFFL